MDNDIYKEIVELKEQLKKDENKEGEDNLRQEKLIHHLESMAKGLMDAIKEETAINVKQGIMMEDFRHKFDSIHEDMREVLRIAEQNENKKEDNKLDKEFMSKVFNIFEKLISVHNKAIEEDANLTQIEKDLYFIIARAPDLDHGHRKILNFLVTKYDDTKKEFVWTAQNDIMEKAKIGSKKYKEYFKKLVERNLIEYKNEGRFVYYRIHPSFIKNEIKPIEKSMREELKEATDKSS